MTIHEPTAAELDLHRRAIEKMRRKLFGTRSLADYYIVDEPQIVGPSIDEKKYGEEVDRKVSLGGLVFTVDRGEERFDFRIEIRHEAKDLFYAYVTEKDNPRGHSTGVQRIRFREMDRRLLELVEGIRLRKVRPNRMAND